MKNSELKKLLNKYIAAVDAANAADDAWDADMENEALEAEFDRCYKAEHRAFEDLAVALSKFSGGRLLVPEARAVLRKRFDDTAALIRRLA